MTHRMSLTLSRWDGQPPAGITIRVWLTNPANTEPAAADGQSWITDGTHIETTTNHLGEAEFQLEPSPTGTHYTLRIGTDPAIEFRMPAEEIHLTPDSPPPDPPRMSPEPRTPDQDAKP